MDRRKFIEKTTSATIFLSSLPVLNSFGVNLKKLKVDELASIDPLINRLFHETLEWMSSKGWEDFTQQTLGIDTELKASTPLKVWTKEIKDIASIRKRVGMDDFAGNKLIEPGSPSLSLIYHILASPRVKSSLINEYPKLVHLDAIENYIYGLRKFEDYVDDPTNCYLVVLAYEYRPSYKSPPYIPFNRNGNESAQLVFSRCGVARIGDKALNYDPESRSFINQPEALKDEKRIAVTPARYGLFLVELVKADHEHIVIMNQQGDERHRHFIKPLCKLSNTDHIEIEFGEFHINEKLKKIEEYKNKNQKIIFEQGAYDFMRPPFIRISSRTASGKLTAYHSTDKEFIQLKMEGSSVLCYSVPKPLIKVAKQDDRNISIKVPPFKKRLGHENRRYSALKLTSFKGTELFDLGLTDVLFRRNRRTSRFGVPRNAPLFLNIKYESNEKHFQPIEQNEDFEKTIKQGNYQAQLFEDNICDGCVSANLKIISPKKGQTQFLEELLNSNSRPLSAFSLVTAPDFFPLLDSNDIRAYYHHHSDRLNVDEDFLEGGTVNLSGIRQRANPSIKNPFTGDQAFAKSFIEDKSFDTITAVVSKNKQLSSNTALLSSILNFRRDYRSNSYLPDTGTGVFFPGWEATFSGDKNNPYFATFGLGSPFPEDIKLCAAANGMWPVVAPDAGRTFQGSLEPFPILGRPSTAIPMLDNELGYHQASPYVKDNLEEPTFGWDGEQGPFLEVKTLQNRQCITVNYTDINRADYIQNLLDSDIGFNMSLIRKLDSHEIINRMECLRKSVKTVDNRCLQYSDAWLIAAEKIEDWDKPQLIKSIPKNSILNSAKIHTKQNERLSGPGYFFVLVKVPKDDIGEQSEESFKRRNIACDKIWMCQVTKAALSYVSYDCKDSNLSDWEKVDFLSAVK